MARQKRSKRNSNTKKNNDYIINFVSENILIFENEWR
jgi:hypothetical protein